MSGGIEFGDEHCDAVARLFYRRVVPLILCALAGLFLILMLPRMP